MKNQDPDQVGQITRISQLLRKAGHEPDDAFLRFGLGRSDFVLLLRKAGHEPDDAVEITERISNMASTNVITEIRSYTRSQDSKLDSIEKSMNAKYNTLIWIAGVLAAAGVFNTLADFFNWGA